MARRTSLTNTRLISELNMTSIMDLTFLLLLTFISTVLLSLVNSRQFKKFIVITCIAG